MDKNNLLILIILITICFVISTGINFANDNIQFNENLSSNHQNTLNNTDVQCYSKNNSNLSNNSNSSEDNATINYLIKNKEKYDNTIKKSTKKDRTFKIGKYKLTLNKKEYRKFLYAKFIEKYVKSGKNITLLEKIFKINKYDFVAFYESGVTFFEFPTYHVSKKTNKFIKQKIGTVNDYKTKKIYFNNYKKAKLFKKQSLYKHKIKYDKKLKKYYVKVSIPVYEDIKTKKARVYIQLRYLNNKFNLNTYTKYDNMFTHPYLKKIIRSYTVYKSSKNISKLNKSKIKKYYQY